MIQTYVVLHHHRFGVSIGLVESDHIPGDDEVIRALSLDFEGDREEWIEVEAVDTDNVPRLLASV